MSSLHEQPELTSCPSPFQPQAYAPPASQHAAVCASPAAMRTTRTPPSDGTGAGARTAAAAAPPSSAPAPGAGLNQFLKALPLVAMGDASMRWELLMAACLPPLRWAIVRTVPG